MGLGLGSLLTDGCFADAHPSVDVSTAVSVTSTCLHNCRLRCRLHNAKPRLSRQRQILLRSLNKRTWMSKTANRRGLWQQR